MNDRHKPFVTNAADRGQVKNASRMERDAENRKKADMRAILSTEEGRRWMWGLLGRCGVNRSIWHPSALIHYNSGKQDLGHEVMADMIASSPDGYLLAQSEAIARDASESSRASATQHKENTDG